MGRLVISGFVSLDGEDPAAGEGFRHCEPLRAKRGEYRPLVLDHDRSTDGLAHRVSDSPRRCLKIG